MSSYDVELSRDDNGGIRIKGSYRISDADDLYDFILLLQTIKPLLAYGQPKEPPAFSKDTEQ